MKKQILAYITALINIEIGNIKRFKTLENVDAAVIVLEVSKGKLNDLADFVADLKEEPQAPESTLRMKKYVRELEDRCETFETTERQTREITMNDNARYLKRILELEESCENMCEIEKNLQKRIDKLTGTKWVQD